MKITGWIILVLGILSFTGAALASHSVFGPTFFIALGAFLIHKSGEKNSQNCMNYHKQYNFVYYLI